MNKYEKAKTIINDKKREDDKQKELHIKYETVDEDVKIVEKKNVAEWLLRLISTILLYCLSAIGVITLIYPQTRQAFTELFKSIFDEITMLL